VAADGDGGEEERQAGEEEEQDGGVERFARLGLVLGEQRGAEAAVEDDPESGEEDGGLKEDTGEVGEEAGGAE
jgi:hypothetical protein